MPRLVDGREQMRPSAHKDKSGEIRHTIPQGVVDGLSEPMDVRRRRIAMEISIQNCEAAVQDDRSRVKHDADNLWRIIIGARRAQATVVRFERRRWTVEPAEQIVK